MTTKQPSGQLKVEPLTDDENVAEQLAASCARIEVGLSNIADGVLELLEKPGAHVVLTMDGPEPSWLHELRVKYQAAKNVHAQACVVSRDAIANVLTLIDLARKKR